MGSLSRQELEALAEEAVVDAYGEWEQTSGFAVMIEDNLGLPFTTVVLGVEVMVVGVDSLDLPLPAPAPEGAEWIEAWRHWKG